MQPANPIKTIINGAFGKMGLITSETLETDAQFHIVGRLGKTDDLIKHIHHSNPDVIIDLTRADCVYDNCLKYLDCNIRFVIGASGLTPAQIQSIAKTCKSLKLGAVIVPNFSIGSVLCTLFAKMAAPWFDGVDIIEMHHHLKADSPSGTAIHTAQAIHEVRSDWAQMDSTSKPGREHFVHGIPIHAVRMPGILAMQQTLFGQMGETINLQHQIIDRKAYMPGLKLACKKVLELDELKIGLEHWLIH